MSNAKVRTSAFLFVFALLIGGFQNCGYVTKPVDINTIDQGSATAVSFSDLQSKILTAKCTVCHSPSGGTQGGVDLSTYAGARAQVILGNPDGSPLYLSVTTGGMPKDGSSLATSSQKLIYNWISSGATNGPTVSAGGDKSIQLPTSSITLTGTASDSSGGIITAVLWSQVSGPAATMSGQQSYSLALTNLTAGTYVFQFQATNDLSVSGTGTMTLTVLSASASPTSYSSIQANIITAKCLGCHGDMNSYSGLIYYVTPGNASTSKLYIRTLSDSMPQTGTKLTTTEKSNIQTWINAGAPNN